LKRKRIIFTTFLVSYLLLAIIIVTVCSAVYSKYIDLAKKRTEQLNLLQLEKNIEFIDKKLQDYNNNMIQLVNSDFIGSLTQSSDEMSMSELVKMQSSLKSYDIDADAVKMQLIGFKDKNFIISRSGSSLNKSEYFNKNVRYENMPGSDFEQTVSSSGQNRYFMPQANVSFYGGGTVEILSNIHVLKNSSNKTGYISTLIDVSYLKTHILDKFERADCFVLDENMSFLFGDKNLSNENYSYEIGKMKSHGSMVSFSLRSEYNRWTYVISLEKDAAYSSVLYMRNIAAIVVICIMLFGIAFSIIASKKNAGPIQKILELVDNESETNVYENIYSYIALLKHDINDLHRYFEKNEDFIKGGIIKKLLDGGFASLQEVSQQCSYTGLDFQDKEFWVVIIKSAFSGMRSGIEIQEQELLEALGYAILEQNKEYYPEVEYYLTRAKTDTMVILFCYPKKANKETYKCQSFFERMLEKHLKNKIGDEFYIKTGKVTDDATQIADTYLSVLSEIEAIRQANRAEEIVPVNYWYPLEVENRLVNVVANGITADLKAITDEITSANFKNNTLGENDIRALYYELKATLVKLLKMNSMEVSVDVISSPNEKNAIESVYYILNLFTDICQQSSERNKSRDEDNFEKIRYFIEKNYWNQDMSLALIGQKFNLSEPYISILFKKNNLSYAGYLEKERMESACKLLLSERIKMIEVAEIIGYNSDQSFRRAFKRYYGISPKKYKELYSGRGQIDET